MNNTDLIWRNLSDFWGRVPDADRQVIEKLWEGWMQCLDAEYNQLYQLDFAKTLETCPVFSKYRWCLLDLSKKNLAKVRDYVSSIRRESFITQTTGSAVNDALKVSNHVDHRHFTIEPLNFHQEIVLPFGLEPALVEGYRLYNGPTLVGTELSYGPDFLLNQSSIKLGATIDNQTKVSFLVGVNETNLPEQYDWKRYSEYANNKKTFILPETYDTAIGMMVFVDGKYLNQNEITYDTGNTVSINFAVTGNVEFIWYLKDAAIKFNQFHNHVKQYFIFNPDAISGTGAAGSVSYLALNPPQSLYSELRYSGPEAQMRLLVAGKFLPSTFWIYDPGTGIVTFTNPIVWSASEFIPIAVEFFDVQDEEFENGHIHVIRQYSNVGVNTLASTFDDGGRFDDKGFFDSVEEENQFELDFEVEDPNSLRIFFNGKYLYNQYDYILSENKKTIYFKFNIKNGNFRFEYERAAGRFTYGATDLDGLNPDQIRKANLLLFYNEDREMMAEFDVNSPEVDTKANDAYKLASQDIYCVSIPVLQNRVDNADVKYIEKTLTTKGQYKIVYGGIQSDVTLPEYLWCPVVYFDESFLAKNFGIFVNYIKKQSSEPYKQALKAIWSGLWNGPVIENVEWIISMFLNIPYIPEDGTIVSITPSLVYTEILTDSEKYYLDSSKTTNLNVGDQVFLGQGLESAGKYSGEVSFSSLGEFASTRLEIPLITVYAKKDDLISIATGSATGIYKVIRTENDALILNKPLAGAVGLIQDDEFDATVFYDNIQNSIKWPQFSQYIEVGSLIYFSDVYTSVKIVNKLNGALVLESLPPIAVTSGINFKVYNNNQFAIVESGIYPYVKRNSTIRAINRFYLNRVTLNNGQFVDVPSQFDLDVAVGQKVSRFQPVSRQVAVYDNEIRNDWLYEENSAFIEEQKSGGDDTVERIIDSVCNINGYWITDNTQNFIGKVQAGDQFLVSSGINVSQVTWEIELVKNNKLKLKNELSDDENVYYSVDRVIKVSETVDTNRQLSAKEPESVTLIDSITASTLNIRVNGIENLPDSGVLKATSGTNTEFIKYGYKINNELRDCVRLFNRNSGNIALQLSAGHKLELIFEFSSKILREVFYAGVRGISEIIDNAYITENSDKLYSLIKNNTTIVEMFAESGINQPDLVNITDFLRKILPASSFWFVDINKGLIDPDERPSEETAVLGRQHFNCVKTTDTGDYTNTGIISTSTLAINITSNVKVGDYVYIPSFTNQYAKITAVGGTILTLDRLLDPTQIGVPFQVISPINSGVCESEAINALFSVYAGIQKGCTVTVIEGLNVGQYPVTQVIGNRIIVGKKFIEFGNSIKYNFYVTSNEGSIL